VVKDYKLTYPLVLDLEENKHNVDKKQLTDAAIAFLEYLENAGYWAMLYTGKSFLDSSLDASRLKPYALWVARYGPELGCHADIWQYTSSGHVNGITGSVDMNWSYRDFASEIRGKSAPKGVGVVKVNVNTVVRKGPNAAYDIVSKIEKGQAYKTHGYKDGWYNVGSGWVYGECVTFKGV
jgi:GH25 family lysozyme M1 (1,4-beta-N-acetylmuramidase)